MTSKERIHNAFEHKDTDKVPRRSQAFEGDVPPENIYALYEAAKQFDK